MLDFELAYKVVFYGVSALLALLVIWTITSVLDSIPLIPQLMEVIGLGFTLWFSYSYLIFKETRDELLEKLDEIKKQILGDSS